MIVAPLVCAAALVHTTPLPHSGTAASQLHWVQAKPSKSAIYGLLFGSYDPASPTFGLWASGASPSGAAMKVLWVVRRTAPGRVLTVHGIELGGGMDAFFQSFRRAGGSAVAGANYPSIVDIPHAGCWQLTVATRGVKGTFVVEAFEP